jgi:hypothetical protein
MTGGNVAVELREGSGCRADSCHEVNMGIATGISSTGDTIRHSFTHCDRRNVEPRWVTFLETKIQELVQAAKAAQKQLRAQTVFSAEQLHTQEDISAQQLCAQEKAAEHRLRAQKTAAEDQLRV